LSDVPRAMPPETERRCEPSDGDRFRDADPGRIDFMRAVEIAEGAPAAVLAR
jgi:hypothetical protein